MSKGDRTRWVFTPSFQMTKIKGDRLWWFPTKYGDKTYPLIGLVMIEVRNDLGEELVLYLGPIRIGIAMRFAKLAVRTELAMREAMRKEGQ